MIAVFGSINLDLIATTPKLPDPGETIGGHEFTTSPGGKGANQALAAARAGGVVRMYGAVGGDRMADEALAELDAAGIDLDGVAHESGATGIAMILVDDAGENVIVVVPGANGLLDDVMAEECVAELEPGDILMLQQEIPAEAIRAALEHAGEREITTMLNIAPYMHEEADLAHSADIIVANETEFAQLVSHEFDPAGIEEIAADWARTHNKIIIITLGADGAVAATPEASVKVDAPKITPVDTVGAGDTFCGYLAAGLDNGLPLEAAVRRAVVAGSIACLAAGAQPSIPLSQVVDEAVRSGSR